MHDGKIAAVARADVDDVDWMADDVDFVLFSHEVAQLPEYVGLCRVVEKSLTPCGALGGSG